MPSQDQLPVDAGGGASNGFDDTTPNGGGGGCGGGRKHSSFPPASTSESNDDGVNMQGKRRARSGQSLPPTMNDVDVEVEVAEDDQCRHNVAMTNQQLIESITRREALRHVEMAWRAQQRLMRRCLGLRFLGDPQSVAIIECFKSSAAAGDGSDAAEPVEK